MAALARGFIVRQHFRFDEALDGIALDGQVGVKP
jgi:hypothetical protein